jgi:hypothetical protein
VNDIYTAAADGLKGLDLKRPIREADIAAPKTEVSEAPEGDIDHG